MAVFDFDEYFIGEWLSPKLPSFQQIQYNTTLLSEFVHQLPDNVGSISVEMFECSSNSRGGQFKNIVRPEVVSHLSVHHGNNTTLYQLI